MTEHQLDSRGTLVSQPTDSQSNSLANSRGTKHRTVDRHIGSNSRDYGNGSMIPREFQRRADGFGADQIVPVLRV